MTTEPTRPDIETIEQIATDITGVVGLVGKASILIKEDLIGCITYIRHLEAEIEALKAKP